MFYLYADVQPYYCGVEAPDTSAGGGKSRSTKYLKFGHSMTESFECDLSSLLGQEAFFYDPYIVDEVFCMYCCADGVAYCEQMEDVCVP